MRFLFFFFLILLGSCQKSSPNRGLCLNIGAEPNTLDPRRVRGFEAANVCRMLFEGLTRTSKEGNIELAIAERIDISEDGLRYRFSLKKTNWSNGEPVTAYDFAQSWKTILDPQFPTDIAYQLYLIKNGKKAKLGEVGLDRVGIETPDPYTLIVELEEPIPYFLDVCSTASFLPVPTTVAEKNPNWMLDPATFVGNGPFVLGKWDHTDQIEVIKNPTYWEADSVGLNEITLMMVSPDTEIRMFEEKKLDWAGSPLSVIPPDAIQSLKSNDQLKCNPLSGTYFFRVNTNSIFEGKMNPLANSKFRKALAMAIDRELITTHLLQGGQLPAQSLVPPGMGLLEEGYFVGECRGLLSEALKELGCNLAELEPVAISFGSSDRNKVIAQAVQKQWEEVLGIRVELSPFDSKVFFQKLKERSFQLAAGSWIADYNDPINFLEVFKFKEGSTNNTGWENSKYIDLLNSSTVCRDQEARRQLMRQAEEILMDEMPIIPIFHFASNYLQGERVKEVALSSDGRIDFRWAHVEPSE